MTPADTKEEKIEKCWHCGEQMRLDNATSVSIVTCACGVSGPSFVTGKWADADGLAIAAANRPAALARAAAELIKEVEAQTGEPREISGRVYEMFRAALRAE